MDRSLIEKIGTYARRSAPLPFPPTTEEHLLKAERRLGFALPELLRLCYLDLGNGGFGPGYGLIGVEGGYASDFGFLVETHDVFRKGYESEGRKWPKGLLPFCEWGCLIFSCVDCSNPRYPVVTIEAGTAYPQSYSLSQFFDYWMEGVSILDLGTFVEESKEIINPFNGEKTRISRRRRE